MKKLFVLLSVLFVFGLAACSDDTSAPVEESEAEGAEEGEEEVELTADEVLERSLDAAEGLESAEMSMDMSQTMETPGEDAALTTQTAFDAEIIMEPLTMYQTGTVTLEMEDQSEEQQMELYLAENTLYMYDDMNETWMKMDADMMQLDQLDQQNPVEQLEMMERFTNEMEMEETEDQYVLKITGDGDELMELTEEITSEFMDEELMVQLEQEGIDIYESMNLQHVYYEIFIDKETFDTTMLDMEMEMSIEAEGEALHLNQTVTSEYTGINTVDSIDIPEEVQEEAVDVMEELENLEGMEEVQ